MKVSEIDRSEKPQPKANEKSFTKHFKRRTTPIAEKSKPPPKSRLSKTTDVQKRSKGSITALVAHGQIAQNFKLARTRIDTEAARLGTVRSDHHATVNSAVERRRDDDELSTDRFREKIAALEQQAVNPAGNISHLQERPESINATLTNDTSNRNLPSHTSAVPHSRAAELIQKIDFLMKSKNPAIAVTLNDASGLRAEIEKTGRNTVSITLASDDHEIAQATISHIQTELATRGLRISRFCLAGTSKKT